MAAYSDPHHPLDTEIGRYQAWRDFLASRFWQECMRPMLAEWEEKKRQAMVMAPSAEATWDAKQQWKAAAEVLPLFDGLDKKIAEKLVSEGSPPPSAMR